MQNKTKLQIAVPDIVTCICGIVLAIGVMTIFAACGPMDDGTWMMCHYVQLGICALGVCIAVLSVVRGIVSRKVVQIVLGIIIIVLCIVVILLPGTLVGMCMMDTMRCHAIMAPFARIMAIVCIVCACVAFRRADKGRTRP